MSRAPLYGLTDAELRDLKREWRKVEWQASKAGRASGVFTAQRNLDAIYRELKRRETAR